MGNRGQKALKSRFLENLFVRVEEKMYLCTRLKTSINQLKYLKI